MYVGNCNSDLSGHLNRPKCVSLALVDITDWQEYKQTKCKPTLYGCYRIIGLTLPLEMICVHTLLKTGVTICIIFCWHARIIQRCKPAWSWGGLADLGRRSFANFCNFIVHIATLSAAMSKGLRRMTFMFGDAKALKYSKLSDLFAPAVGAMRSKQNSPRRFASIRRTRMKSGKSSDICWHRDIPRLS